VFVPPDNEPPSIEVLSPAAGDVRRQHAVENFRVEWTASDPEADDLWVSVYVNTQPELDDNEVFLRQSRHTPAETGFFTINSAELDLGTYWVYCQVTDGGTTAGSWSAGTVTFVEVVPFHRGDANADGRLDVSDAITTFNFLFLGGAQPQCRESADANDDTRLDISDGIFLLSWLSLGGPAPTAPGPAAMPCGLDPRGLEPEVFLGCAAYPPCVVLEE
jgi:hypothetical protein